MPAPLKASTHRAILSSSKTIRLALLSLIFYYPPYFVNTAWMTLLLISCKLNLLLLKHCQSVGFLYIHSVIYPTKKRQTFIFFKVKVEGEERKKNKKESSVQYNLKFIYLAKQNEIKSNEGQSY